MLELARRAPGRTFNMVGPLLDRHVAEGRGDTPAVRTAQRDISYAGLQEMVNRAGNALRDAGVEPEQRVAILVPDGAEFVAAFLGAMKIGAVPVPMNTAARRSELQLMMADCRARALVAHASLVGPADQTATAQLRVVFVVGGDDERRGFTSALERSSSQLDAFATGVDEPCYWLYSSGTTGRAKGVVHLHGDMLACVTPYAEEVVGIEPEDVTFSVARLFFSYGLVNSLFLPLLAGASVFLMPERPDVSHILDVVQRQRPTLFFSVPTSYGQLCAALAADNAPLRPFASVRLAISAGEPLPEPLYGRWKTLTGVEVLDGLGSTEVGYIFCSNLPGRVRPGSSGVLIGDHRARLVDENGHDTDSGELWVAAASTALHYWNEREQTKQSFVGEWLRTGDRYVRDTAGYFWYQGRTNDVFKVSGQWVSPLEIESCLLSHPDVLECAVVGTPDEAGLLKPRAFVVRRPGSTVAPTDLQALVKTRLQPHKYPRWVEFVDELPKTASGKVQRFMLRR
ncbi:MAG: benzoate-CoA ligase family protein [Chloroflexi bacterium]|nr:benzoate-CoA ligase family protein [Chloroflexota bacterium]